MPRSRTDQTASLAEALSVPLVGAEYRAAVAFVVLLAVLVIRPAGIGGVRE